MINVGTNSISNIKIGSTQAKRAYVGTTIVWKYNKISRLPSGYTEVEYIQSTSNQYIDLDIMLYDTLNKNYDIAIKFEFIKRGIDIHKQATVFGCQDNTGSPWPGTFIRTAKDDDRLWGRYIGGTEKDVVLGTRGTIIELPVQVPPNKNVTNLNNSNKTHTWGTSLFCIFNTQDKTQVARFSQMKLYYFKLFVEGELVRDMIPCINPNNVVGLYDLANDVFYSSPNGVAFVAGNEV